jgi:AraC family L-rhamnose operon transcriptional activator RhaR
MEIEPTVFLKKSYFASDFAATMVDYHLLDYEVPPHGHEFFEIGIVTDGTGGHISAKGIQTLRSGDLVIVRPGAWHGYLNCQDLIVQNCCFDYQLLQRELGWLREDAALNYMLWTGPYAADRHGVMIVRLQNSCLSTCLEHLNALRKVQSLPHRIEVLGRLLIFLDSLACSIHELEVLKKQTRPIHPAVLETMRLLESQIDKEWSLKELAEINHLNPSYLVRLFKGEVGLAPIAYLHRCRMEHASGLLLHTITPIADVAAQVGWFDSNLFARRFRQTHGMSPSEYRKRFGKLEQ